nr:WD40 repeat domain-containing protein [Micromonospora sp. DSM 115978]
MTLPPPGEGLAAALATTSPTRVNNALEGHSDYVRGVAFSPDSTFLVSASDDGTAILWDVADPANAHAVGDPLES